ncbi:hypothetical protein SAMN04488097_0708 [Epilithonimonas lactis]|nr:hypothetical protein SAMN04488097_0708 [Epilithonimonas lactis]
MLVGLCNSGAILERSIAVCLSCTTNRLPKCCFIFPKNQPKFNINHQSFYKIGVTSGNKF